ncbi:hypothetical protein KJ785_02950 [Patescibacteria group bacterium]|nr:hypothetical protein [Patescibacteria group bacterium]
MKKLVVSLVGIFFLLILIGAGCASTQSSDTASENVSEENVGDNITASVFIEPSEENDVDAQVEVVE